jgi:queuine tRNA-ribosyltransferase
VETPAFMPVGTQATVKGLTPESLRATGSRMVLANAYHLALRPGEEVVAALGGLHRFMGWSGPILTDSGGFQAFSMADRAALSERGVTFRSHLDGRLLELTPERAVAIQQALGADVAMCLDHCPALPAEKAEVAAAVGRTLRWAARCREAHTRADQALFGIVQGGSHADLRAECAEALAGAGLRRLCRRRRQRRGEPRGGPRRPAGDHPPAARRRPRYLMGVGRPQDILDAIATGIDLFDCVLPTRNGRNATCLTAAGVVRLRNAAHRLDPRPVEPGCDCPACRHFSRAYLRHLFLAKEMLGPILATVHNLSYLHRLTGAARAAIAAGRFAPFRAEALEALGPERLE